MPSQHEIKLVHGVFVVVDGMGVLLNGKSGIGKSELALGLINRNHQLVADDSVNFYVKDNRIYGKCPDLLQDFLEVRGLGILNIRAMFGDASLCHEHPLDFIIEVFQPTDEELHSIDRLHGIQTSKNLLGIDIKQVSIPVAPGRNLSILVESAVINFRLQTSGYYAVNDFSKRHEHYMYTQPDGKEL